MVNSVKIQNTYDYLQEVTKGNIQDQFIAVINGGNPTVPTDAWEMISALSSAPYPWPSATTTVRIKAGGHADDDSDGDGARAVTVYGLDHNLNLANETLVTNGISASLSTTTRFWRVFSSIVSSVGLYGATNVGAVTIENNAGTADLLLTPAGDGKSPHCSYSICAGYTGLLLGFESHHEALKPGDTRICSRQNLSDISAPFAPALVLFKEEGIEGGEQNQPSSNMGLFPSGTDLWLEANGGGNATSSTGAMEILMIKNEQLNTAD